MARGAGDSGVAAGETARAARAARRRCPTGGARRVHAHVRSSGDSDGPGYANRSVRDRGPRLPLGVAPRWRHPRAGGERRWLPVTPRRSGTDQPGAATSDSDSRRGHPPAGGARGSALVGWGARRSGRRAAAPGGAERVHPGNRGPVAGSGPRAASIAHTGTRARPSARAASSERWRNGIVDRDRGNRGPDPRRDPGLRSPLTRAGRRRRPGGRSSHHDPGRGAPSRLRLSLNWCCVSEVPWPCDRRRIPPCRVVPPRGSGATPSSSRLARRALRQPHGHGTSDTQHQISSPIRRRQQDHQFHPRLRKVRRHVGRDVPRTLDRLPFGA